MGGARRRRTRNAVAAALALGLALTACSGDEEPEKPAPAPTESSGPLGYDPDAEPAGAVLSLVPGDAVELRVTDWEQVRLDLAEPDLDGTSSAAQRRAFARKAAKQAPLMTDGVLRAADTAYQSGYGFGQDDVAWEAVFTGPSGDGWIVKFRDGLDMKKVQQAAKAGVGPLGDATVDAGTSVAGVGFAPSADASWAADGSAPDLTTQIAAGTLLRRGCLSTSQVYGGARADQVAAADLAGLDELDTWAVSLGGDLATVRLGEPRPDAFDRARIADSLPRTKPALDSALTDAVADPRSGRIGYVVTDPTAAAELVRDDRLAFALCATT